MAMDNTLLSRAVVQNEFRTPADLVDRIIGGSGPGGLKAVAPTGSEEIVLMIGEMEQGVSILGEKLAVLRAGRQGRVRDGGPPDCRHQQRDDPVSARFTLPASDACDAEAYAKTRADEVAQSSDSRPL